MKILFALIVSCSLFSCQQPKKGKYDGEYTLVGHLKGFNDSTKIFLEMDDHTDSVNLLNGSFSFKGKLAKRTSNVLLRTEDFLDYKFLWLESSKMLFQGTKGNFENAVLSGSATQTIADSLYKEINPFDKKLKLASEDKRLNDKQKQDLTDSLRQQINQRYYQFIAKHPNSPISLDLLSNLVFDLGKQKIQSIYDRMSADSKKTAEGKKVATFLKLNQSIEVGKHFADFTQYTPAGVAVSLSSVKGKLILLDFWASWCMPCRRQNPILVNLYNRYKQFGLVVVAVSTDENRRNWVSAIKKDGLNYVNLSEKKPIDNTAAIVYGINKYPTTYLIDSTGTIVAKDLDANYMEKFVKGYFNRH